MSDEVPLSAQQEAFLAWMGETPEMRHPVPVNVAIRITDELDVDLLRHALRDVSRRHEALRTVFPRHDGRHRATVLDDCTPDLRQVAARGSGAAERLADARERACLERDRPFDLEHGPLVHAVVIDLDRDDHLLFLAVHHLVFDAWSMSVLLKELGIGYSALRTGSTAAPPAPAQCSELVRRSRLRWPENRERWRDVLAGAPSGLPDFPGREPSELLSPRSLDFHVDGDLAAKMRATAARNAATPFMVVLSVWCGVLSSWTGATDIVAMSPTSGRTRPGSEAAMGCLFSSLLIRLDLSGYPAFPDLLRRTRSAVLRATELQDYPYAEFGRRFAHAPRVGYYSWSVPLHFPGLRSGTVELPTRLVADLEIPGHNLGVPHLALFDQEEGAIPGRLDFNANAFEQQTIEQLSEEFVDYLQHVVKAEERT